MENALRFLQAVEECQDSSLPVYVSRLCEYAGISLDQYFVVSAYCIKQEYVTQDNFGNFSLTDEGRVYLSQHDGVVLEPTGLGEILARYEGADEGRDYPSQQEGEMVGIGQKIIDAIISGSLMHAKSVQHPDDTCVVVWSAGTAEQLEALVKQHTGGRI